MSIRIVVAGGSARPGNFTSKALALVVDELERRDRVEPRVLDPQTLDLRLPGTEPSEPTRAARQSVADATGVILATPEYHGSFSSVMKLLIDNLGFPSALAGKPVALLGVAAGQIGAIKALEHLRSVCSHVGALVLPGPVSVAGVQKLFDADGRCLDEAVERRVRGVATAMTDYIEGHICPRLALEEAVRTGDTTWMDRYRSA